MPIRSISALLLPTTVLLALLTGDAEATARAVASVLEIDEVAAGMTPETKYDRVVALPPVRLAIAGPRSHRAREPPAIHARRQGLRRVVCSWMLVALLGVAGLERRG